jgi:DNA-binding transcriptional ArsR family regulator
MSVSLRDALAASVKAAADKALATAPPPPSPSVVRAPTPPSQRFTKLPDPLLARRDLTPTAKLLLALMARRAGKTGVCCTYYRHLARDLGISKSTLLRALAQLKAAGWVEAAPMATDAPKLDDTRMRYVIHIDKILINKNKNAPSTD